MTAEGPPLPAVFRAADQAQAGYFREQLRRELDALERQAEKLQAQLDEHLRCNRALDVFRAQGDLRAVDTTRRSVVGMLSALTSRFPEDTSN